MKRFQVSIRTALILLTVVVLLIFVLDFLARRQTYEVRGVIRFPMAEGSELFNAVNKAGDRSYLGSRFGFSEGVLGGESTCDPQIKIKVKLARVVCSTEVNTYGVNDAIERVRSNIQAIVDKNDDLHFYNYTIDVDPMGAGIEPFPGSNKSEVDVTIREDYGITGKITPKR